jgi:hypothetical protein
MTGYGNGRHWTELLADENQASWIFRRTRINSIFLDRNVTETGTEKKGGWRAKQKVLQPRNVAIGSGMLAGSVSQMWRLSLEIEHIR